VNHYQPIANFQHFHIMELAKSHNTVCMMYMWVAIIWRIQNHRNKNKVIFNKGKIDIEKVWSLT